MGENPSQDFSGRGRDNGQGQGERGDGFSTAESRNLRRMVTNDLFAAADALTANEKEH